MQKKVYFLIVFVLLLVSFYAHREANQAQGQFLWYLEPRADRILSPPDVGIGEFVSPPEEDACVYQAKPNKEKDNCYGDCPDRQTVNEASVKQCCDYEKDDQGNLQKKCKCKDNVNPCTSEKKCTTCMAYAEAGGTTIPNECMGAVMCTIKNRVNNPKHKPPVKSECEAVAQGDGQQYNPYKCVCNGKYANQKYCKCCAGQLTGAEKDEYDNAAGQYDNLDCSKFPANTFNNAGMNSWASRNCRRITPPAPLSKCKTFDFYECVSP